jgi:hypothetical protein
MTEVDGITVPGKYAVVSTIVLDKGRGYATISVFDSKAQRHEKMGYPPDQIHYDYPVSLINGSAFTCVYNWLKQKEEFVGYVDA